MLNNQMKCCMQRSWRDFFSSGAYIGSAPKAALKGMNTMEEKDNDTYGKK
jgi:hypothetical protein